MSRVLRSYTQLPGGQVHYRYAGDRHLPVLVLLHQTPSHSSMYLPLMQELADQFYIIAPDTPGFGGSDPLSGECSIASFSERLLEFLQALGVEVCTLFGHHTGASIAVQMAFDDPGRFNALALCGPTLLTDAQRETLPAKAAGFPAEADGSHLLKMWQRVRAKDEQAVLSLVQREVLSALVCGELYQASYRAVCAQDFATQLAALGCPVLAFAGDQDLLITAVEPSLALLSNGHTASLPTGAGTYACEQQAAEMAVILSDFVSTTTRT
ncbi:MAG: alpha/beta hydrolase [Halioglobus sp.]